MPAIARSEQRRIVICAAAGMAGVFVVIALLVRASGQPWSTAAGIAGLPTVFGGWYFGAMLPLSRHDFSEHPPATAASAATTVPSAARPAPSREESVRDDTDAIAPAA